MGIDTREAGKMTWSTAKARCSTSIRFYFIHFSASFARIEPWISWRRGNATQAHGQREQPNAASLSILAARALLSEPPLPSLKFVVCVASPDPAAETRKPATSSPWCGGDRQCALVPDPSNMTLESLSCSLVQQWLSAVVWLSGNMSMWLVLCARYSRVFDPLNMGYTFWSCYSRWSAIFFFKM